MKLLFIHQNFPSQYRHLAEHYAADPANQVTALGEGARLQQNPMLPGVRLVGYQTPPVPGDETFFMAWKFEEASRRALMAAGALKGLKESGFEPDVILLHPDWGDGLLVKVYYPRTPILAYAENYYSAWSEILDFDPASEPDELVRCLGETDNAVRALNLVAADHLSSPFNFQRNLLPLQLRRRASRLHDGIDTDYFAPVPKAALVIPPDETLWSPGHPPLPDYVPRRVEEITLTRADEVFTFATRALEPQRGWSSFARALPRIQARRPKARCIIVGRNNGYYGPEPEGGQAGKNWRDVFLDEVHEELDFSRIHFLGPVPQNVMRHLMALSRAHVYLTYPSVLSYSPLEAMSTGAPLVGSDTSPVREVIMHGENGLLVDFHDPGQLAEAVCGLLEDESLRERLGRTGRETILHNYDLRQVCLPRWDRVIRGLARGEIVEPLA